MPNIQDLKQFFEPFDVFDGRTFEYWELDEIFPNLSDKDIEDLIAEESKNKSDFRKEQSVRFTFILDEIADLKIFPFSGKMPIKQDFYLGKPISKKIKEIMLVIAKNPNVQYNPKQAYSKFFKNGPAYGEEVEKWLRTEFNLRLEKDDYIDFTAYVNSKDKFNNYFTKLMFVRAMKAWDENFDEKGNLKREKRDNI